jgi:NAD(P)-dependent dehydrogenase (short-subunit alcohol dehydrogenase family)
VHGGSDIAANGFADTPLKRFGMPDEVAAIVVTLAWDEATYITGRK